MVFIMVSASQISTKHHNWERNSISVALHVQYVVPKCERHFNTTLKNGCTNNQWLQLWGYGCLHQISNDQIHLLRCFTQSHNVSFIVGVIQPLGTTDGVQNFTMSAKSSAFRQSCKISLNESSKMLFDTRCQHGLGFSAPWSVVLQWY